MFGIAALVLGYGFVGAVSGGVFSYLNRLDDDRDDVAFFTGCIALVWPFAWLLVCVVGILKGTVRVCEIVGRRIGRARYHHKIVLAKTKLMEEDLQRYNGNQELAVRWNYKTCKRCYGSGCSSCHHDGVERVPA